MNRIGGIYAAIFLPPALFLVVNLSSLAAGAVLAAILAVALLLPRKSGFALLDRSDLTLLMLCIGVILIHLIFADIMLSIYMWRALSSLAVLPVLFFGATALSFSFLRSDSRVIEKICWRIFFLMIVLLVAAILGFYDGNIFDRNKVVFPFSEPSHFTLAFIPFLMFVCVTSTGWRRYGLLLGCFALAYWVENLTMLVGCFLVAAACARALFFPALLFGILIIGYLWDFSYFTERLNFSTESSNLSTLVYLQGWELAIESLRSTSYWGLGFQQLGVRPTAVLAAETIYQISGSELNQNDGGFLLAKLVSEFGILGIIVAGSFSFFACRIFVKLRSIAYGRHAKSADIFASCVIVSFLLDMYVRGVGYYSGSTLLLLMAMHYCFRNYVSARLNGKISKKVEFKVL